MLIKKVFVYLGATMSILLAVQDCVSQVWAFYSTALQGQNSFPSKRFKVTRNRSFKGGRLLLRNGDCCRQLGIWWLCSVKSREVQRTEIDFSLLFFFQIGMYLYPCNPLFTLVLSFGSFGLSWPQLSSVAKFLDFMLPLPFIWFQFFFLM